MQLKEKIFKEFNLSECKTVINYVEHVWSHNNVILAHTENQQIIFKQWKDNMFKQMLNEENFFKYLISSGYKNFAQIIYTKNFASYFLVNDKYWRAYKYLPGEKINLSGDNSTNEFFQLIGKELSIFHSASHGYNTFNPKKRHFDTELNLIINTLNKIKKLTNSPKVQIILNFLNVELRPLLPKFNSLPKSYIHGDFNLENIILSTNKKSINFIDFEFSRYDIRIFDLASLYAPMRDANGNFILAEKNFITNILKGYIEHCQLQKDELSLLFYIAIFHFASISMQLFQGNFDKLYPVALDITYKLIENRETHQNIEKELSMSIFDLIL